jgi:hypothetical protein
VAVAQLSFLKRLAGFDELFFYSGVGKAFFVIDAAWKKH